MSGGFIKLNNYTFLNAVTASTVTPWIPLDYKLDPGGTQRTIMGSKVATSADTVDLQLRILTDDGVEVITTATSWGASVTNFSAVIQGQATHARINKVGSSAAATVVGII